MAKSKAKKKKSKSKAPETVSTRKLSKRVERFIEKHDVTYDELAMAGVGYLGIKLPGKKHKNYKKRSKKMAKRFDELVERGERLAPEEMTVAAQALATDEIGEPAPEPVISYQAVDGGWFAIEIDGVHVERVQGEDEAARMAGDLLANYAALDPGEQQRTTTAVTHTGGGWYDIVVHGVPVDRVRGKDAAMDRFGHLLDEDGDDAN